MEIPPPPHVGSGHFRITLHDPDRWAEPAAAPLPWLPLTMIFDLPHLQASLLTAPGAQRLQGLFMLDTGGPQSTWWPLALTQHAVGAVDTMLTCPLATVNADAAGSWSWATLCPQMLRNACEGLCMLLKLEYHFSHAAAQKTTRAELPWLARRSGL